MVAELGGAQREACEGGRGGHVRVRRGEGRLELVGVVGVTGLVMWVDGWGGEEPVWVGSRVSRVVGVGADTQGHLVNYSASLGVGETVTVLEERWWGRARGQDGVGVVTSGEGGVGRVGQKGVCGQALGMCVRGGRSVCGAAVWQVCEGVCVDSRGDVSVRSHWPIVAVPLFVAVV